MSQVYPKFNEDIESKTAMPEWKDHLLGPEMDEKALDPFCPMMQIDITDQVMEDIPEEFQCEFSCQQ